jgi:hypothetical protein
MKNKKKKTNIFFSPRDGSAPLAISWYSGPKGDAVEANNEIGIGFFGSHGELLMVEFDDVNEKKDHQVLEFDRYRVEVTVNKGKISHTLMPLAAPKKGSRSSKKNNKDVA